MLRCHFPRDAQGHSAHHCLSWQGHVERFLRFFGSTGSKSCTTFEILSLEALLWSFSLIILAISRQPYFGSGCSTFSLCTPKITKTVRHNCGSNCVCVCLCLCVHLPCQGTRRFVLIRIHTSKWHYCAWCMHQDRSSYQL